MTSTVPPTGQAQWVWSEQPPNSTSEQCREGDHIWVAAFYVNGGLAHWQCAGCGETNTKRPEPSWPMDRLADFNGWIKAPPLLVARGPRPPVSTRRWMTADGSVLVEGDPSSIHHVGLEMPGLGEAYAYTLVDVEEEVLASYEPRRKRMGLHSDHYWLTRYRVVGDALMEFVGHCFEESTYDTPFAQEPRRTEVLTGLEPLPGRHVGN